MHPQAQTHWRGPKWALSVLLAGLGMLGPFAIDTYLPAFSGIERSLAATPVEIQQTLSAYLLAFAFMSLFHGSLSDHFGRRPVVLAGLVSFTLASAGCATSHTIDALIFWRIVQGLSTGAGIVVSRAVIRDMFAPDQAQKVMSQVTLFFGVAPALAPMVGGWLFVHLGWPAVFWALTAAGALLVAVNAYCLPETLDPGQRQAWHPWGLVQQYARVGSHPRFWSLALASGVPFNGMFLYVLSAPAFLGGHLHLAPTEFFWFFICTIGGIMTGALISGRLAGRVTHVQQVHWGMVIMLSVSLVNVAVQALGVNSVALAILPIGVFSMGWALMTPVVTLMVLDIDPQRRGLCASMQAFVSSATNGVVAGALAPLVMNNALGLALASLALLLIGMLAWVLAQRR